MPRNNRIGFVYPHRYFHITRQPLGATAILKPNREYEPAGVSFSPTIRGCLEGVPFYYTRVPNWHRRKDFVKEGDTWYVYTPIQATRAIIPDTIDDFERTRERRVLHNILVTLIGIITVSCTDKRWEYQWQ